MDNRGFNNVVPIWYLNLNVKHEHIHTYIHTWLYNRQTLALTQVEDAIPGPVPAPALQLLVLCVLKPTVVKHHTDDALEYRQVLSFYNECRATVKKPQQHTCLNLSIKTLKSKFAAHLHHFTGNFWEFPNFPVVKHSNFIGLTCNGKILMWC